MEAVVLDQGRRHRSVGGDRCWSCGRRLVGCRVGCHSCRPGAKQRSCELAVMKAAQQFRWLRPTPGSSARGCVPPEYSHFAVFAHPGAGAVDLRRRPMVARLRRHGQARAGASAAVPSRSQPCAPDLHAPTA
jgi:hypothetical protein